MDTVFDNITLDLSYPLPSSRMGPVKFWHELSWNPALITVWSLQGETQAVLMFSKEMEGV